jgi:ribokinase
MVAELRAEGVDVSCVAVDDRRPSGLAVVVVDDVGENSIVVSAGASGALSVEHVQAAAPLLRAAAVTLLSLEVPLDAVLAGAELAGGAVVLNPAPARPLPPALLRRVEVLVPNRGELAALTGGAVTSEQDVVGSARALDGPRAVLVTLGADGAVLVSGRDVLRVPAQTVAVVDTTGAGDALCGALADALARGGTLAAATEHAVAVAAQSVAHAGARGVVRPSGA